MKTAWRSSHDAERGIAACSAPRVALRVGPS